MNDPTPPPAPAAETPAAEPPAVETAAERAEKAAIRRRWISLAEWVGIAALLVSAAGLWMSWSDRKADQAERATESNEKSLVAFTASRSGNTVLTLNDPDHRIQEIDVAFPPALGVDAQTGLSSPQIDASWFERPLLKVTDKGADDRQGRLPVLITATWWDGDTKKTDRAIYQVRWKTSGRLFGGRKLELEGASLAERGGSPARLDALWAKEKPRE